MSETGQQESIPIREVFRLALRCWPYYRPMLKHLLTFLVLNVLMAALFMGIYFVGNDLIENKILVGERLRACHARFQIKGRTRPSSELGRNQARDPGPASRDPIFSRDEELRPERSECFVARGLQERAEPERGLNVVLAYQRRFHAERRLPVFRAERVRQNVRIEVGTDRLEVGLRRCHLEGDHHLLRAVLLDAESRAL